MERKLQPDTINQNSPTKQDNREKGNMALKDEVEEKCSANASHVFFLSHKLFVFFSLFHVSTNPWLVLGTDGKIIKNSVVIYTNRPLGIKDWQ